MPRPPLDTAPDMWNRQIQAWREMTPLERASLADRLSVDVIEFARAGIDARFPDTAGSKHAHEMARRRFGSALADAAFGLTSDH